MLKTGSGEDDGWGDFIASEDEYLDLYQPRPKQRAKTETERSSEVISLLSDDEIPSTSAVMPSQKSDSTPQPKASVGSSVNQT